MTPTEQKSFGLPLWILIIWLLGVSSGWIFKSIHDHSTFNFPMMLRQIAYYIDGTRC